MMLQLSNYYPLQWYKRNFLSILIMGTNGLKKFFHYKNGIFILPLHKSALQIEDRFLFTKSMEEVSSHYPRFSPITANVFPD